MNSIDLLLGLKLWKIQLSGNPLDMVSLPVPQSGLSLLAVSIAGLGVRIYDQKHYVDSIKTLESVSSLKYGRLGQEERAMAMITCSGGLNVKILKRTADFSMRANSHPDCHLPSTGSKFWIPKKTKLFIEQTIRERLEATKIHMTLQQAFLRSRLNVAMKARERSTAKQEYGPTPITLQVALLGLGKNYVLKLLITKISKSFPSCDLFLICRGENALVQPRVVMLPIFASEILLPIALSVTTKSKVQSRLQILLCKKNRVQPLTVTNIMLPPAEDDIDV